MAIDNKYITVAPKFFEEKGNYTYTGPGVIGTRDTIYLNDNKIPELMTLSYDKVYEIKEGERVNYDKNFVIKKDEHKTFFGIL